MSRQTILSRVGRILRCALLAVILVTVAPVIGLRWVPPPTTAFMLEKRAAHLIRGERHKTIHHRWIGRGSISSEMRLAVVASEDQKFPHHRGFDFESIADAVLEKDTRGRLRGASTISQQVARNLFLWPGRSYLRKGLEAYFTVLLELLWPKRRILEVYLNVAEFGDGIYGVSAASQAFFGKRPADLGRARLLSWPRSCPTPADFTPGIPQPTCANAPAGSRSRWLTSARPMSVTCEMWRWGLPEDRRGAEERMTLRESVQINAPPERVWQYLEDPERMKLWNPKIKDVVPMSWGQRSTGFRYRVTYVMGGREREFSAEIEEYQPPVKLVLRHTGVSLPPTAYAQEMYELSHTGGGTLVIQTILVHNLRINFFLRLLVSFLHRFGKPTGKKYLIRLKELAESAA